MYVTFNIHNLKILSLILVDKKEVSNLVLSFTYSSWYSLEGWTHLPGWHSSCRIPWGVLLVLGNSSPIVSVRNRQFYFASYNNWKEKSKLFKTFKCINSITDYGRMMSNPNFFVAQNHTPNTNRYSFQIAKNCLVKKWLINSKSSTRDSQFQKKVCWEHIWKYPKYPTIYLTHLTEVRFACFLSGGFTNMAVINPPKRKLAKCTFVHLPNRQRHLGYFEPKNSHHASVVRWLNYVTYLKWGFSGFWGSAVTLSGVSEETFPYLMPGLFDASISSVTSWPRPPSEEPHCFSTKTRRTKSPSSPWLKVQGTMQNRPSGSRIRLLTSLRFTNVSVRST